MTDPDGKTGIKKLSHHDRKELCTTRPRYRQGKKLTAVKVCFVFLSFLSFTDDVRCENDTIF
jgi:hypothetical protein